MFDREKSRTNIYGNVKRKLKNALIPAKKNDTPQKTTQNLNIEDVKDKDSYLSDFKILDFLEVEKVDKDFKLERIKEGTNNFILNKDKYVYFRPPISERGIITHTYSIDTGKGYEQVLNNKLAFNDISNIDDVLIRMTKIMSCSVDSPKLISPQFGFLLKLTDEATKDYSGEAKLVAIDNFTPEYTLKDLAKLKEVKIFNENYFLDRFIGLNYGINVKRNRELRTELFKYLNKLAVKRRRKKISTKYYSKTDDNIHSLRIPGIVEPFDFPGKGRK